MPSEQQQQQHSLQSATGVDESSKQQQHSPKSTSAVHKPPEQQQQQQQSTKLSAKRPSEMLDNAQPIAEDVFLASNGWFFNFLKRHNLSLRRTTTSGRDLPANCLQTIAEFLEECERELRDIDHGAILNMDETAIYQDAPGKQTYEHVGAKRVPVVTAGGERTRISAAFTAAADGTKLPPLIIIPREKELAFVKPPNCNYLLYCDFYVICAGEFFLMLNI
jgi:hypothetical protein